jgi:tripartite-type tricarboxylate transporter receptor subunit TctC
MLALTTKERSTLLTDLPALKGKGIEGGFGVDRGLVARKEIVTEILGWFKKASEDPVLIDRLVGHATQS